MKQMWIGLCMVLCVIGDSAVAKERVVYLSSQSISSRAPSDTTLGTYFVATVAIPEDIEGSRIHRAFLECFVDVDTRAVEGVELNGAVFEVYALTSDLAGEFAGESIREPSPMRVNVPVGSRRMVRLDLTETVRWWMQEAGNNHGLVMGSLSNLRAGLFTIRGDVFRNGAVARLRLFTR